ncbi:hypothetical protein CKO33_12760 [Ectothiorhodospira mobilis]|nr:hypothetical protein [Ectothiorhodospira mobilis]
MIDNPGILDILASHQVERWFREEGAGRLVIRGRGMNPGMSLVEYFDALPGGYVISRLNGRTKGELAGNDGQALDALRRELERMQRQLELYQAKWEEITLSPDSLTREILSRYDPAWESDYLASDPGLLRAVQEGEVRLVSRSDWYQYLRGMDPGRRERFRLEVVDAAYNRLFIYPGEAFAMDRIRVLGDLPDGLLEGGLAVRAMREKLEWIQDGYRLFGLVSSLATDELVRVLADEAMGYIEDKAKEQGLDWMRRENWYGLYDKVTQKIGIELT